MLFLQHYEEISPLLFLAKVPVIAPDFLLCGQTLTQETRVSRF